MTYKSSTLGKIDSSVYNSLTHSADDLIKAYSKVKHHKQTVEPAILMAEYVFGGTKKQGKEIKSWLKTQGFSEYASTKAVRKMSKKASRGRSKNSMKHKIKVKEIEMPDLPPPSMLHRSLTAVAYSSNYDIEIRLWYQTYDRRPDDEMEDEMNRMWNTAVEFAAEQTNPGLVLFMDEIGMEINMPISSGEVAGEIDTWHAIMFFDDKEYNLFE